MLHTRQRLPLPATHISLRCRSAHLRNLFYRRGVLFGLTMRFGRVCGWNRAPVAEFMHRTRGPRGRSDR